MTDPTHLLLRDLVEYARREMRVDYREFLELRHGSEEDRRLSPSCLSRADFVGVKDNLATYRFYSDEIRIREQDTVLLLDWATDRDVKKQAAVARLDLKVKEIGFAKLSEPPASVVVLATTGPEKKALRESLAKIAESPSSYPLAEAILNRKGSGLSSPPKSSIDRIASLREGFLVVQGPPGTGKTYTGSHAILEFLRVGKRIGIMAQSHKAMNELVVRVAKLAQDSKVELRGLKAFSKDRDKVEAHGVANVSGSNLVKQAESGNLIVGTIFQMARLEPGTLDVLFFDEAGQLSLAEALGATRGAKAAVFLGDHRQLPHVSKAKHPGEAGSSLMGYLLGDAAVVPEELGIFLDESRRMNRAITTLISDLCYDGKLKSHPSVAEGRLALSADPGDPLGPASVVFLAVEHSGNEQSSAEEAQVIADLVHRLRREAPEASLLVVAAYRAQENEIRSRVGPGIEVGTVDKFQGKEADVVFYSLAASDPSAIPRDAGFLLSLNRLNVALSRARKKAILVCSPRLLEVPPSSLETMRLANGFCRVRAYHEALLRSSSGG